jgi:hypothetical protein
MQISTNAAGYLQTRQVTCLATNFFFLFLAVEGPSTSDATEDCDDSFPE